MAANDWHKLDVGALKKRGEYSTKKSPGRLEKYRVSPADSAKVCDAFREFIRNLPGDITGFDIFAIETLVQEEIIHRALKEFGGNTVQAARFLAVNRTTLYEKCRKLGIATGKNYK